jgi:hypothetical protein
VRSFVVVLLLATARTTLACPPSARCVIDAPPTNEVAAPKRAVSLRIAHLPARVPWKLDEPPPRASDVELPWIWQVLRREVYDRMPRYRGDDDLTFVLAPVVVTGSFDTVPGLGVAGDF